MALEPRPLGGHTTQGLFTEQIPGPCQERGPLQATDPTGDHQLPTVTADVSLLPITLWDTASSLYCVDTATPCNDEAVH